MDDLITLVGLVGRDALLAQIQRHLSKGRPVLLTGPPGIGKSALLRAVVAQHQAVGLPVLAVEQSSPAKPLLVELAAQLHAVGGLPYESLPLAAAADRDLAALPWSALHKALSRLQLKALAAVVLEGLQRQRYVLVLDHLDHVTPTQKALLHSLFEVATVLGAAVQPKATGHLASLWWSFKTVEVPPLDAAITQDIIATYISTQHLLLEQPRAFRRQVVRASGGNPRALGELLADASRETYVGSQYVREEVKHAGGDRYLDLTPVALLAICCVVASRYLAKGLNANDLYVMAGVASALFMFARLMLIRGRGRGSAAA